MPIIVDVQTSYFSLARDFKANRFSLNMTAFVNSAPEDVGQVEVEGMSWMMKGLLVGAVVVACIGFVKYHQSPKANAGYSKVHA